MPEWLNSSILLLALLFLCLTLLIFLIILLVRQNRSDRNCQHLSDSLQESEKRLSDSAASSFLTLEERLRNEITRRQEAQTAALSENFRMVDQQIEQLGTRFDTFGQTQEARLHRMSGIIEEKMTENERSAEKLRENMAESLEKLQKDNAQKLEEMRRTVDEKLHETLNKRLGESFSLVNERLEQVYKGLGEMQTLASGVGDLKKVLSNVKTRGIWGEVQLGSLLSQMLAPSQFAENVQVAPHIAERVEYAVILPGKEREHPVYLPIDSKFPFEAYERLLKASEAADAVQCAAAGSELVASIKTEAKRIAKKYILPPYTTDFAVMFLATEGLYAEALRCRGLLEELQQNQHILVAGPSTLSALLSSLQIGFKTLAIEQRSAEVWQLLGAVKTEFGRFSDLLDQTQQRLHQAGESIEKASAKSRAITRRLRDVEALNDPQSARLLSGDDDSENL